jgi:hypothetical protein
MKALGVGSATYSKLVAVLGEAHDMLNAADHKVARQIHQQLGGKLPPLPKRK